MIVAGIFDLAYYLSSMIRFSAVPKVGHVDLTRRMFGYLKNYPKIGYAIEPQPLTIDADYEKVQMSYYVVNKFVYFSEDIDENFLETTVDELEIHVFVDSYQGHNKFTGR